MTSTARLLVLAASGALAAACSPARTPAAAVAATPAAAPADTARVFEMRTYITHPGRLDALQRRFREHTTALFVKHGMTNVGYWVPEDGAAATNTLVYVLAYPSRDAARASWAAFSADPEWRRVREASEASGPIVLRVESVFMRATSYSPLR